MIAFYSWKVLVYKLKIFKNCKELKHIMIMITAIIYIFYLMQHLINSWKLLPENPQPPWKNLPPPPLKIQKVQAPLFANIENF